MSKQEPNIRRTDRAEQTPSDLMQELSKLRKPLSGDSDLAQELNLMVREGDLYVKLPGNRVECFACGHRCKISDGGRGICQVRYNVGGTLFVPRGYVAALQSDPIEKKPFFHVYPGSDALTFGMLGCDLHCAYCFPGDTMVVTDQGPTTFETLYESAERYEQRSDADIAYLNERRAVTASGQLRRIEAVFKHPYSGKLAVIKPFYLPELRCTPDHHVYATDDVATPPEKIQARLLTNKHYLAIPRQYTFSTPQIIDCENALRNYSTTYRVPWDLSDQDRAWIQAASDKGVTSREIGVKLGKSASYIRHVRGKLRNGRGGNTRTGAALLEEEYLRFPNEHRPGIPRTIPLDERMARVLGYYCAEGSVVSGKQRPNSHVLNFTFSLDERAQADEVESLLAELLGVKAFTVKRDATLNVTVSKSSAALLFKALCAAGAKYKRVPMQLFDAPRSVVESFLEAYAKGDGHRYQNGKSSITTTSTELAYGIAWLALKLGYLPSIYDAKPSLVGKILGRTVNRAPHQYSVVWYKDVKVERRVIETKDYYLVPLRSVSFQDYDGLVYNLQVENEHNYLANFFLVSNCQNWDISQALRDSEAGRPPSLVTPKQLVEIGKRTGARAVVSSYNEPLITSEWAVEVFKQASAIGFLCAYVSNGNATREVLEYIKPYVRAYKIDLKSMRDKNYRQLGAPLDHILDGIKMVHEMGFWLEIVTLIVPGFNDSDEELRDAAQFIASISRDIPWHVTAFHQDYRMQSNSNTTANDLLRACEIGRAAGLNFIYAGNLPGRTHEWENTYCPHCHELLIERQGFMLLGYHMNGDGTCPRCKNVIPGIWHSDPSSVRIGDAAQLWTRRPRAV